MKRLQSLLTTLWLTLSAAAQPALTLEQATELARENYPAVARYGLLERTTAFSLANASKAWLPHGAIEAKATWQNDVAALPEILTDIMTARGLEYPGLQKTQYKVGIDLQQQIWDGGKTAASRSSIRSDAATERAGIDVGMHDLDGRIEELYFSLLLLDENIVRSRATSALLDSTLQQMKSMQLNGVATQSDCDQVEASLLASNQQQTRLASLRESYRHALEIFIGEPLGSRRLQLPADPSAERSERPQLKLFDARMAALEAREAGVKASVMPTVGAFASAYYGYPGFNMFKNMQSRDPGFNFLVGVKVSWNFGSLYTRSNSLRKLRTQREQVEADRALFLFNNSIAETEAEGRIRALREQMKSDERIVELRRSVMNAAGSRMRNGVIDTTSLLSKITDTELAENDLTTRRIELTRALYNLNHIRNR